MRSDRVQTQAAPCCMRCQGLDLARGPAGEPTHGMHAGARIIDHQVPAAVVPQTFKQRPAPASQLRGGMAQVAIKGTASHQFGQNG